MIENRTNNVENSSSRGSLTAELNWDTSAWTHHSIPLYSLNRHGITINNRQQGFTEDRSTVCALAVTSQNSITSQEMVDLASVSFSVTSEKPLTSLTMRPSSGSLLSLLLISVLAVNETFPNEKVPTS